MVIEERAARARVPWWVWAICAGYTALPPALHTWLRYFPPAGAEPTGLQGADSVVFLHSMRMFATGFYTPFASCHAVHGDHFLGYFATPFFWLYGAMGALGHAAHIDEFMTLGFANGVAAFVYLLSVYAFLREAVPRRTNLAFALFALGGGPGGILYMVSSALGWTRLPSFEMYFQRFAMSLIEGGYNVMAPRLYYTIPLALCLMALTLLIRAERSGRYHLCWWSALLLAAGTFLNLRIGPMAWTIGALYLCFGGQRPSRGRIALGLATGAATLVGWAAGWWMMSLSPTYAQNALRSVRNSLPFSTFAADAILYLAVFLVACVITYRALPRLGRVMAGTLLGYLAAFAILYAVYQAYYGNILVAREYAVTIAISDWALLGAVTGLTWSSWRNGRNTLNTATSAPGWALLWFLLFFALSISAFGHGWFMRLVPARLLALMGLPLSILAAEAVYALRERHARLARGVTAAIVVCGLTTIAVAYACFMGPLDWRADNPAFAWTHSELMTTADANVISHIDSGTVLTPYIPGPQFSDVISLRPRCRVILGMGTLNISDLDPQQMESEVGKFFSRNAPEAERLQFVRDWCVDFVFCSDTRPPDAEVVAELRAAPWLQLTSEEGKAVLFRVLKP
ncbi:MAG: hypothetical protein HZB26_15940 [Candidatus Hydrogenedentes bacterium]|nr:hypothetical protein [Candidatus Hydrogenedentota bacterium]